MARFDLFSKRQRDRERVGQPDVYTYDIIPQALRVQISNIASRAFGTDRYFDRTSNRSEDNKKWVWVEKTYLHEVGAITLGSNLGIAAERVRSALLACANNMALDIIELISYRLFEEDINFNKYSGLGDADEKSNPYVSEINYRLREAGVG